MEENGVKKIEGEVKREWPALISTAGGIATLIGLCVTLGGGVTWLIDHHRHAVQEQAQIAVAQTEVDQSDYQAALQAYAEILKDDPGYQPALDGQLKTAELGTENFHIMAPEGQDTTTAAGAMLDQIMAVLEAGLTRASSTSAKAEIQAHIGWVHFLNAKIAEREPPETAEQNLRAALKLDPNNVYANAMLGNWLLENNGNFDEAMHDFDTAVASNQQRPLVRTFELGGLQYLDHKGARAAQVRVADAMRKDGEPLDESFKSRIVSFCFDPPELDPGELTETLTAVSPDDEWKTYLWLDDGPGSEDHQQFHEFIQASLLEIGGDKAGALAKFRDLDAQLKNEPGSFKDAVEAAIRRTQG